MKMQAGLKSCGVLWWEDRPAGAASSPPGHPAPVVLLLDRAAASAARVGAGVWAGQSRGQGNPLCPGSETRAAAHSGVAEVAVSSSNPRDPVGALGSPLAERQLAS